MNGAHRIGDIRLVLGDLFREAEIPDPWLEADRIFCHALSITRASLHAYPERAMSGDDYARVVDFAMRRLAGEPLAYLFGSAIFCGRTFEVDAATLIPRTETEILTERASARLRRFSEPGTFADWCTGSGCIAITLLLDNPGWGAFAVDASESALAVARSNARAYGVAERILFIRCADPGALIHVIDEHSIDLIVSNPPYIPTAILRGLDVSVRDHEPRLALDGGADGLDVYRLLLRTLPRYMKPGAPLYLETGGASQVEALRGMAGAFGLDFTDAFIDHRGIERFAEFSAIPGESSLSTG